MPALYSRLAQDRNRRGFTLVELLTVIVIVGILASLAVPSFRSFVVQQRIKTTSFDMMASLTLARSEAIKRNSTVSITPTDGSNWQSGWAVAVGATPLTRQAALSGLSVICKSGTAIVNPCPAITYNSNGRVLGTTPPSIEISSTSADSSSTRCISVDLSGRPNSRKAGCP